jgi:hypothetical protein
LILQVERARTASAAITLRTGVVVNIVAKDPSRRLQSGRRFLAGVYTTTGYYKRAVRSGQIGDETVFSVGVPRNVMARLFVDSDNVVTDEQGRALSLRQPGQVISIPSGAPEVTIRTTLQ